MKRTVFLEAKVDDRVSDIVSMEESKRRNFPKWGPHRIEEAYGYAMLGATDAQMAHFMNVSVESITYWKKTKPEFADAVRRGRAGADIEVVKSFYKACTGLEYEEDVITTYRGNVTVTRVKKVLPPNAYACIKWLGVRQREFWADVSKIDINQNVNVKQIDPKDWTTEELNALESVTGLKQLVENVRGN